jgi:hypothetical protein
MQLANVRSQIQSNDIANLRMFTEIGKLAIEGENSTKPFQDFVFLVRDYEHGKIFTSYFFYFQDNNYGFNEGEKMLNEINNGAEKIKNKREFSTPHVREVFEVK